MRGMLACCACLLLMTQGVEAGGQGALVARWNAQLLHVAEAEDGLLTLKGVRTTALMHLAMAGALAPVEERSDPELTAFLVAAAARTVATTAYPDQAARWESLLARARPPGVDPSTLADLRERAERRAARVVASREDDGWATPGTYRWESAAPGVYAPFPEHSRTPPRFVFGAGWAKARPFALRSPDEFRVAAPPPITSEAYALAHEEVRLLGAARAPARNDDQTHLALWWKDFVERSHNRLARQLIEAEDLGLEDAVHLLAWLNASIFDAYVASFDSKFHHNHWRPYTAIRWADDANAGTTSEADWTNLHDHTYAFPSYPSAHGTACGAAMTVLAHVFGDDRPVTMRTERVASQGPGSPMLTLDPATRHFESFADAADECGRSRVYLGIHFAYDATAGVALGRQVGRAVLERLRF